MEEKIADLLAQYDLVVYRAGRVKGAWMLETDQGLKSLGSCSYSEGKVKFEQKVKQFAKTNGFSEVDLYVPNREQNFLVSGPYNEMFVMRDWFYGEECNVRNQEHVVQTVETLAQLHNCLTGLMLSSEEKEFCCQPKLTETLEKRNKELRRVRTYIRSKKQKSLFEQKFLSQFELQLAQAERASELLDESVYENYYNSCIEMGSMLHGNFTHHSVMLLSGGVMAVTGFDKAVTGVQIYDFYLLFRKMMEKWEWDISLGESMLTAYDRIRPIPKEEYTLLYILLSYPEKFWKVANQYYNNRKSWIPEKNMQKLLQTMEQAEKKEESIKTLFT
ncbi:MAG: CotS family spore coat protein [Lachnospiraceae bacterium]|nr:CotS family spore coat protein [Lachnospiraceae bacterium]